MREYSDVVVVGGGASGLMCGGAVSSSGMSVAVLEKNSRPGRKLQATGNGRCNFTNRNMGTDWYYGDEKWMGQVLDSFGTDDAVRQMEALGVFAREKDGYIYPYTNQASTVVDALVGYCVNHGAEIATDCHVSAVRKEKQGGYRIGTAQGEVRCRYVVLAAGGKASGELGGSGSGYKLARSIGHSIHSVYPGLTGLKCGGDFWSTVAGTRVQGRFSLLVDNQLTEGECGEIQIARDGVSGIPVFQLCRVAAKALSEGRHVEGLIDFVPPMDEKELSEWVGAHGVAGIVPSKWHGFFRNRAELAKSLKAFRFAIKATYGMERAQVTAGGADTSEIDARTMESLLNPGVFLVGELLDIDGKCGGYNLHFAWASALAAAREIIKRDRGAAKGGSFRLPALGGEFLPP